MTARAGFYARLDERARILFALAGVLATVATWRAELLAVLCAAALGVVLVSGLRWREARRFAVFAAIVVALLVATTWLALPGTPAERNAHALSQSLRMVALCAFTAVLPFTIAPSRWGVALRRLGLPDRMAYAVELAFRFVPSFARRFERTLEAQRARGLDLTSRVGPLRRLARLVPVLLPVLMDAVVAGEDVADALDLRGFGARRRTWTGPGRFGPAEWAFTAAGVGLLGAVAAVRAVG